MVEIRQLGLLPYVKGLFEQARAVVEVRRGALDGIVLVVRHPPVVTFGRRAARQELHVDRWQRRGLGVDLFHVDRGGGATYHYPGQAVVYPVLHLGRLGLTMKTLAEAVGRATVGVLQGHGIEAKWETGRPGVYVAAAKIASVGFHLAGEVTTHGVALNVGPEVDGFQLIDPCKERNLRVTSIAHLLGRILDPDEVGSDLARAVVAEIEAGLKTDQ
jgi:lipoate-protein ligase B